MSGACFANFCEGCFGWSLLAASNPSRDGTEDFATTSARPEPGCDAGWQVYFLGRCPGQLLDLCCGLQSADFPRASDDTAGGATFPSWPGVAYFAGPLMLRELPRLAATLFPGKEHPRLWTKIELSLVQVTVFQLVFRQPLPGVPRTLNANEMCTFMVWVSFPANFWCHGCKTLCTGKPSFCKEAAALGEAMASSTFRSLRAQHF